MFGPPPSVSQVQESGYFAESSEDFFRQQPSIKLVVSYPVSVPKFVRCQVLLMSLASVLAPPEHLKEVPRPEGRVSTTSAGTSIDGIRRKLDARPSLCER